MGTPAIPDPIAPPAAAPPAAAPPATPPASGPSLASRVTDDGFDADRVAAELIDERGGGYKAAFQVVKKLLHDNKKARARSSDLRRRVVSDGDVVLKKDTTEQQEHQRLTQLGLTAAEIKKRLDEREVLQSEVKRSQQATFLNEVADAIGITNKKAWIKLAERSGIAIEVRDVQTTNDDGTKSTKKHPFARLATETSAPWRPLDVYLDEEEGEFRSALYTTVDDDGGSGSGSGRTHAPEQRSMGTPMTPQSGASGRPTPAATTTKATENTLANKYAPRKAKT